MGGFVVCGTAVPATECPPVGASWAPSCPPAVGTYSCRGLTTVGCLLVGSPHRVKVEIRRRGVRAICMADVGLVAELISKL